MTRYGRSIFGRTVSLLLRPLPRQVPPVLVQRDGRSLALVAERERELRVDDLQEERRLRLRVDAEPRLGGGLTVELIALAGDRQRERGGEVVRADEPLQRVGAELHRLAQRHRLGGLAGHALQDQVRQLVYAA